MIVIEMNNGKVIKLELDETAAPKTVANFNKLVSEGFYDGLSRKSVGVFAISSTTSKPSTTCPNAA